MQYKPILLVHKSFHINGGMGDHVNDPFRIIFIFFFFFFYLSLNYLKRINELGLNYYFLINIIEFELIESIS